MSAEEVKDQELADATPNNQGHGETAEESLKAADENPMPSAQKEEATIKKKYGGIIPKKPPLISKDHERAYFDSADWALGKQGAHKPKGPLEALRPKLQPTPHQQMRSRHASYSRADDVIDGGSNNTSEDDTMDVSSSDNTNTAGEDPRKP